MRSAIPRFTSEGEHLEFKAGDLSSEVLARIACWILSKRLLSHSGGWVLLMMLTDFLNRLGILVYGAVTNAGVLLYGKEPTRWLPQARVRSDILTSADFFERSMKS